jgi:sortase A
VVGLCAITVVSALALFLVVFGIGCSTLGEQRAQHQLYAKLRGLLDPASPTSPAIGGVIPPGTPVALLAAPTAGIRDTVVVEGTASGDLLAGPGHLRDTVLPGQQGQSILFGKSLTAGAPFAHIAALHRGDVVTAITGQGRFSYDVVGTRIPGDPVPTVPAGGGLLTLVTSSGPQGVGRLAPDKLVYVDATLRGTPVAAAPGSPLAVPVSELPGRSDPSAWPLVVIWLIALVFSATASAWAWWRWGRWKTWLVGGALVVGALYGAAGEAMRLLPNLV